MENWKQIPDHPLYEVSDLGRIRRVSPATNTYAGKILRTFVKSNGYIQVTLQARTDGVVWRKKHYIHRLVAFAFLSPDDPNCGREVNHKNFDKSDNRADNLHWCDRATNLQHAWDAGRKVALPVRRGIDNCRGKMTDDDVRAVRAMKATGAHWRAIAAHFGVSKTQVNGILRGERRTDA